MKGAGLAGMAVEQHMTHHPHKHGSATSLDKAGVDLPHSPHVSYGSTTTRLNTPVNDASSDDTNEMFDDQDYDDDDNDHSLFKNVLNQLDDIWNTVQLKAVWRPMAFVYVFNVMQVNHPTPFCIMINLTLLYSYTLPVILFSLHFSLLSLPPSSFSIGA